MRRAKTDLSEADLKRRQCLPIFEKNHKARMWLDKSNSLGGYPSSWLTGISFHIMMVDIQILFIRNSNERLESNEKYLP